MGRRKYQDGWSRAVLGRLHHYRVWYPGVGFRTLCGAQPRRFYGVCGDVPNNPCLCCELIAERAYRGLHPRPVAAPIELPVLPVDRPHAEGV